MPRTRVCRNTVLMPSLLSSSSMLHRSAFCFSATALPVPRVLGQSSPQSVVSHTPRTSCLGALRAKGRTCSTSCAWAQSEKMLNKARIILFTWAKVQKNSYLCARIRKIRHRIMASFIISLVVLLAGYFIYGTFVEKVFGVDERRTMPCDTHRDGIDFTPMPTWKVYTVQFLNIAGTGPIFGALMGILYGPAAFLWIVFGCLLGGAMHDYMAGMISIRRGGASLPEIIGDELGSSCRLVMRVVTLVLMVCVGASFIMIPAGLMTHLMSSFTSSALLTSNLFWTVLMFAFYLCVTIFSVSKIMGNIYPVFGVALLVMAVLIGVGIFTEPGTVPSFSTAFSDHYPVREGVTPLFPGLFITIDCDWISQEFELNAFFFGMMNFFFTSRCFFFTTTINNINIFST